MTETKKCPPKARIRTSIKAGGIDLNHGSRLRIRTSVKVGGMPNHGLRVRQPSQ
jgi:hypothetical protein